MLFYWILKPSCKSTIYIYRINIHDHIHVKHHGLKARNLLHIFFNNTLHAQIHPRSNPNPLSTYSSGPCPGLV